MTRIDLPAGGVDSSAIAALMKRNFSGPVKTFAVGYKEAEYSELPYARYVSQAIGTEHAEIVVGMEDFFNALPRLIDRKSTRLNSSHLGISYAVFCLKKKKQTHTYKQMQTNINSETIHYHVSFDC